jgi:uncharacterized protein (DUF2141 family)
MSGTYAVCACHDQNGNHPIDRNLLGNPPWMAMALETTRASCVPPPPSFADALITVGEGGAETGLTLRY